MSKRKLGALLLALAGLLLSGCSNPSDAASLKSGSVTIEELQESINAILDERVKFETMPQDGLTGEALTRNQLGFHIFSALLNQAAKERNITVKPGEISASRAEVLQNVGGEEQLSLALVNAGIASIDLEEYLALIVLQDRLREVIAPNAADDQQVVEALQKMLADTVASEQLKVNPRYGFWNTNTNTVDPIDPTGGALPSGNQ